jgi:hypothetical protein
MLTGLLSLTGQRSSLVGHVLLVNAEVWAFVQSKPDEAAAPASWPPLASASICVGSASAGCEGITLLAAGASRISATGLPLGVGSAAAGTQPSASGCSIAAPCASEMLTLQCAS